MNNNNSVTREAFVASFTHPRKQELANMLLDGATKEQLEAAGFSRINALEMSTAIRTSIIDKQDFSLDWERSQEELDEEARLKAPQEQTDSGSAQATATASSPAPAQPAASPDAPTPAPAAGTGAPAAGAAPAETGSGDGGSHPTQTIGGNPTPAAPGDPTAPENQNLAG